MLTPRNVEVLALSNVEEVTMYAIKRELKLNNKEKSFFAGCAGFSRFVYNHGLSVAQSYLGNSRFALAVTQNG